ncbi:helix-turn-helix domain-containing protein [Terrarubrum flagellatum]|uniref:winged helix-turn-helix transcriptional regulator n=1 Tax=Terrirubrum flagellatum TaxID=2895980 RepID=UPI0031451490
MAKRHDVYKESQGCPVETALEVIGAKWKGAIVFHLLDGELRFMELRRRMPKVTQRILSKALRELECDGVISRAVYPTNPPQVGYQFTEHGARLRASILALHDWGRGHMGEARLLAAE